MREFDVACFAASTDSAEKNRAFAESLALDYPILSDPSKKVARAYGVLKLGLFAQRITFYIGPQGTILDIDREVAPATAGPDVAERLVRLGLSRRTDG